MLRGDLEKIVLATSTGAIGAVMIASAVRSFALHNLNVVQRILCFLGGVLFIAPGLLLLGIGLGLVVLVFCWQLITRPHLTSQG